MEGRTTEHGSRPCPWIGHLLVLLDQLSIHACNFNHHLRNGGRIQRVYTLLAIADGNSGFVLAQATVVLPTRLGVVRSAEGDHNMYLPGSLKMREHMLPHTGPIEPTKFPSLSPLLVNSPRSSAVPQECRRFGWWRYSQDFRRC